MSSLDIKLVELPNFQIKMSCPSKLATSICLSKVGRAFELGAARQRSKKDEDIGDLKEAEEDKILMYSPACLAIEPTHFPDGSLKSPKSKSTPALRVEINSLLTSFM